jgi:excisionase family DNA binding protein
MSIDFLNGEAPYQVPLLLSIKQTCRLLGLGRTSLYALMGSGQLRSVTVGRRRFVPREAIDEFIARLPAEYRRSS